MRKLTRTESRTAAWLLVALVLVVAYLVLVQSWFVGPLLGVNDRIQSLRGQQQRFAGIVSQRDALQHRLASVSGGHADASAFVSGANPNAATAALMQRAVGVVNAHAGLGPCKVTRKVPINPPVDANAPYREVSAIITLHCGMQPLAAVLYGLAHGMPYVFVDSFNAYRDPHPDRNGATEPLNVQMTVSGYMRASATEANP